MSLNPDSAHISYCVYGQGGGGWEVENFWYRKMIFLQATSAEILSSAPLLKAQDPARVWVWSF